MNLENLKERLPGFQPNPPDEDQGLGVGPDGNELPQPIVATDNERGESRGGGDDEYPR